MFDIFRQIYLRSFLYDKKISKVSSKNLLYKPSTHLLSSVVNIQTKKFDVNNFFLETVWTNKKLSEKQINKLNNFFWLFSLDLKSSNLTVQKIIKNWIEINNKYNLKTWNFKTTSKRIISWLSNCKLSYDESNEQYKIDFNFIIQKQAQHLLNQLDKIKNNHNKLIGISAIILVGISYDDEKNFIIKGLDQLKKNIKYTLDNSGFPKSRNINSAIFLLKYLILIREWFKESQTEIPDFINENIFYLGQSYAFFWKNINFDPLFNGNNISNNREFDLYLKRLGYTFKNDDYEFSDYVSLRNKKINLIMDVGPSPLKKFSNKYQAGALSFEFVSNGKKIITNSGYYSQKNKKLNELSRSSAVHNVLVIDDNSSCKFKNNSSSELEVTDGLKIIKKKIINEKNYWKINVAHDGYLKKYNLFYEREIEFIPENNRLTGIDKIIGKKIIPNLKFDLRFHLNPLSKTMKTQDNKSIFIEFEEEGWKFTCENYEINIDNGLYFGKKNTYTENQNIFISGITNSQNNFIKWELIKI
tara:strand:+ start:712 stop:2295 length:1584 start_codon:yes stop_codon:yes gene_type:complete